MCFAPFLSHGQKFPVILHHSMTPETLKPILVFKAWLKTTSTQLSFCFTGVTAYCHTVCGSDAPSLSADSE